MDFERPNSMVDEKKKSDDERHVMVNEEKKIDSERHGMEETRKTGIGEVKETLVVEEIREKLILLQQRRSGMKSLLMDALQDDPTEETSNIDNKSPNDVENSNEQAQISYQIVKESLYQPFGCGDFQEKFISSSSSQEVSTIDITDALSRMHLWARQLIEDSGSDQLKLEKKISDHENIEFGYDGVCPEFSSVPWTATVPSHQALYGKNSSDRSIGLGSSSNSTINPSSFHRVNTALTSNASPRMNLRYERAIRNADFQPTELQRQTNQHENTTFAFVGDNSEFSNAPIARSSKDILGSSLIRPRGQVHPHTMTTICASPYHPVSSKSGGADSSGLPNVVNRQLDFPVYRQSGYTTNPTLPSWIEALQSLVGATSVAPHVTKPMCQENFASAQSNSQSVQEMSLDGTRNLDMPIHRLITRHGKGVAHEATTSYDYEEPAARLGSNEDFAEIMAVHESCIRALLHPEEYVPVHLMGKSSRLKNQYANDAMGMEMSHLGSHSADAISPSHDLSALNLSDDSDCSSIQRLCVDNRESSFPSFLEVFKSLDEKPLQLISIQGHIFEFSTDQYGSRFIQQLLPMAMPKEKAMVFEEIMPHIVPLITDVFGNFVVQKVIEHGTPFHRRRITKRLLGHVLRLSLHTYGCRVIQKAIEYSDLDQKIEISKELNGSIIECIYDQNGNHVIQKCIEYVPQEYIQFIVEKIYGRVIALSTHPYGCRVIQRLLENCDNHKTKLIVLTEIVEDVCKLSQDQYGNYVVQHVLEHGTSNERSAIIEKFARKVVVMSQEKFASNVIEKCLVYGSHEDRQFIINEILSIHGEIDPLTVMIKDQFANYVVQRVIETCDDWQRNMILERIRVHLNNLRNYTYGRHVVSRVERLLAIGERRMMLPRHPSRLS